MIPTLNEVRCELARRSLLAFTRYTFPAYQANWHHVVLCQALDRFVAGEVTRLMVFMPSQHGKSELVSRRLPAFLLGRDPNLRILASSYSADLSSTMNRAVQRIIDDEAYRRVFPGTRLAPEGGRGGLRNTDEFEIIGHGGYYKSVGVGGGAAGRTADVAIIDDPVKNRAEAESETYRVGVWEWYTSVLRQRLSSDTARVLLTMTRWHEDDLAGRLLRLAADSPTAEQWDVVRFPALAEATSDRHPDDPRAEGAPLWPDRYPVDEMARRRLLSGSYEWAAMYQQRPAPAGGGMFKSEWFSILDAMPADVTARCRFWDCGGTAGGGDPTAGVKIARCASGLYVVEHLEHGQWSAHEVDAMILQTAHVDGVTTRIREEQEPGSSGKAVVATRARLLAGYDYAGIPATGEKSLRWRPFAAQAEAGNVRLLRGSWNRAWLDELALVPRGKHDDQADASAGAFNDLALGHLPGDLGIN